VEFYTGLVLILEIFIPVNVSGDQLWAWISYGYMKITGYVSGVYYPTRIGSFSCNEPIDRGDSTFLTFEHTGRYFGNDFLAGIKKSVSVWISTSTFDGVSINSNNWTELQFQIVISRQVQIENFVDC
jgi:hypothetical protein